jgi:hypothetical protein
MISTILLHIFAERSAGQAGQATNRKPKPLYLWQKDFWRSGPALFPRDYDAQTFIAMPFAVFTFS